MSGRSRKSTRWLAALGVLTAALLGTVGPAAAAPPDNDDFAQARVLTEPSFFNESELTAGATAEVDEPAHAGRAATASIWYSWTAPADLVVTSWSELTLLGSLDRPAHALAFYTGDSLPLLEEVVSAHGTAPGVTFRATAGTEYKIALDVRTRHREEGNTHLYLYAVPTNDNLASAEPIGGTTGSAPGYVATATLEQAEPQHSLFAANGGSVWFDWTAPTTGFSRFGVECCAANQPAMAVYTGSSLGDLRAVSSGYSCLVGAFNTCTTFRHTRGTTYHIAVQGDGDRFPLRWAQVATRCTVDGTDAADVLAGTDGTDYVCGRGGNDVLAGMEGDDVLVGGPGIDVADFSGARSSIVADLARAAASGEGTDTLQTVEDVTGSRSDDVLDGDSRTNRLRGGGGSDRINGHAGADRVFGGGGNDSVTPGGGADSVRAGAGVDLVDYDGARSGVDVDLRAGAATGQGRDRLAGVEEVIGSSHRDHLVGDRQHNFLFGGAADDRVRGRGGDDILYGRGGDDVLRGGAGRDECHGGRGRDTLTRCETR